MLGALLIIIVNHNEARNVIYDLFDDGGSDSLMNINHCYLMWLLE